MANFADHDPFAVPNRQRCVYSMPDGVPHSEHRAIDDLHTYAGSLAWTYEQYVIEQKQLEAPAVDRATWERRRLQSITALLARAEEAAREIVRDNRDEGASWDAIGQALGITKQGAQQRFGRAK